MRVLAMVFGKHCAAENVRECAVRCALLYYIQVCGAECCSEGPAVLDSVSVGDA